jgi:hypothetical protein
VFVGFSGPGLPLLRDAPVKLKLRADTLQKDMHVLAAQELGLKPRDLTLRPVIGRQNHTNRPDEPLDPLCISRIEALVPEGKNKRSRTVPLVALPRSIAIPFASHDDLLDDSDDKTVLLFFKRCAAFLSVLCCTAHNNEISRKPCSCNHFFVCLFCSACAAVVSAPAHCQPLTSRALFYHCLPPHFSFPHVTLLPPRSLAAHVRRYVSAEVDAEGIVVQPARLDLIGLFEADTRATPAHLVDVAREKCDFPTDAPLVCIEEITSQPRHDCQCAVDMDKSLHESSIQDGDILVWAVANHGDAVQQLQKVCEYYDNVWHRMEVEFRDANSPDDATSQFTLYMVRSHYPQLHHTLQRNSPCTHALPLSCITRTHARNFFGNATSW